MKRKLRKIGNSTGLLLPKEILEEMDLYDGDTVEVIYNSIKKEIVLRNEKRPPTSDESDIEGVVVKVLKDKGLIWGCRFTLNPLWESWEFNKL